MKDDAWSIEEARRCLTEKLGAEPESPEVRIASPEDTILHKLTWFKMGGHISERQWGDIQGVLKVSGTSLDIGYLKLWAGRLGTLDILEKALSESGISEKR